MTEKQSQTSDPEGALRLDLGVPKEDRGSGSGPLVTVVIPCYNQAHLLSEAIESVLSQTYPNFEMIVVDDGSTDNTSQVASRYLKVRLIRQDNQGLSAARNRGLAESKGEYIVFLDADDRLLPNALEVRVRQLEAHPESALVSGRYRIIAGDGSFLKQPPQHAVDEDRYVALLRGYGLAEIGFAQLSALNTVPLQRRTHPLGPNWVVLKRPNLVAFSFRYEAEKYRR